MSDATPKRSRRFHRSLLAPPISLTPAATVLYLLTFLLAVYQLDRQNYQSAKREIIARDFHGLFQALEGLQSLPTQALYGSSPSLRAEARRDLEAMMRQVVEGPTSIYEFRLTDTSNTVVLHVVDQAKPSRMRTLTNTLLLPGFSAQVDRLISPPGATPAGSQTRSAGRLMLRSTSPHDYPPITALTLRYWGLLAILTVLWALGYAFLYVRILRPMRRVTARLAESQEAPPQLVERPQVLLESNYNQMAAQALLHILEERLTALLRPADAGGAPKEKVIADALDSLRDWFGVHEVQAAELAGGREDLSVLEAYAASGLPSPAPADLLARSLSFAQLDSENESAAPAAASESEFSVDREGRLRYAGRIGQDLLLAIFGRLPAAAGDGDPDAAEWRDIIHRACEQVRRGLIAHRALEQDVFRQKSEANIVLSRNLGHDLTNIIATTKLDLMAVKRLLASPAGAPADDPRSRLLREAVNGILESTRFLQEIVNIYRSFSHVKRPQYERRSLNDLVDEFLRAFEPSVSSRVEMRRDFSPGLPNPIVEPRLLKLALFNVITNALDAHKRAPKGTGNASSSRPDDGGAMSRNAVVTVRTLFDPATALYQIQIEDNGPGIRSADGRLLDPGEVDAIFRHGYSTKAAEASEGLGLSWVQTIVEQFHHGRVRAENLPQGGARIILALRSMETAEAKIP